MMPRPWPHALTPLSLLPPIACVTILYEGVVNARQCPAASSHSPNLQVPRRVQPSSPLVRFLMLAHCAQAVYHLASVKGGKEGRVSWLRRNDQADRS